MSVDSISLGAGAVVARAWRQAGAYALGSLLLGVGQVVLAPLLTRRLGVAPYGTYEVLIVTYTAIKGLIILPVASAVIRSYCQLSPSTTELESLTTTIRWITIGIAALAGVSGIWVVDTLRWWGLAHDVPRSLGGVMGCALAIDAFTQVGLGKLRAFQSPSGYALVSVGQLFGTIGGVVFLVGYLRWDLQGAFVAMCCGNLVGLGLSACVISGTRGWKGEWRHVKGIAQYALTLVPTNAASIILSVSDRFFILAYRNVATVGIYGLTYRIGSGLTMLAVLPFVTAWPALIFSQKDPHVVAVSTGKAVIQLLLVGILVVTIGATGATPLLLALGGPAYVSGSHLVPIVSLGTVFLGLSDVLMSTVVSRGYLLTSTVTTLGVSVLHLGLNWALIPILGSLGGAIATAASYLCSTIVAIWICVRLKCLQCEARQVFRILFGGTISVAVGRALLKVLGSSGMATLVCVVVTVTIYLWLVIGMGGVRDCVRRILAVIAESKEDTAV